MLCQLRRISLFLLALCLWFLGSSNHATRAAQDQTAATAKQLQTEADRLRTAPATRRAAIEKYNAALPLWRQLGDQAKEATVLHWLCSTHNALLERQQALGYCEQALAIRHELNDPLGEAESLNIIGSIQLALNGPQRALQYYQRALDLRRANGDQRGIAVTLGNLARLYTSLGEHQKELAVLREAVPLAKAVKDQSLEHNLLNLLAGSYKHLGQTELALDHYEQLLALCRDRKDQPMEAATLSNLGALYYETGAQQKALDALANALSLHRLQENRTAEATTLVTLAGVWNALGETGNALPLAKEALRLARATAYADAEFYALTTLASSHRILGEDQKAFGYDQEAYAQAKHRGSKRYEAMGLASLALDSQRLNDLPKALEFGQQAVAKHRENGDASELMYALHELCRTHIKVADYAAAKRACHEALTLTRTREDRPSEAKSLFELARIAARQNDWPQARKLLEEALRLFESIGSSFQNATAKAGFLGFNYAAYDSYIELLMKQHLAAPDAALEREALQVAERGRARTLLTLLAEARTARQGKDAAVLEREQALLKLLERKAAERNRLNPAQAADSSVAREITEPSSELEQIRAQIRTSNPQYAALTQAQPLTAPAIQKQVTNNDLLLLEYALGEEQSFLFTLTGDSVNSYELPKRAIIEQAARRVHDLLTERNRNPSNLPKFEAEPPADRQARIAKADAEFKLAAAELSRLILAPAAAELKNRHLLIVADGALQMTPFAALPEPGISKAGSKRKFPTASPQPLIVKHAITYLPSASVLGVLRQETKDRQPAPKTLAVFADPVFDADDPRVSVEVRERLARERQTPAPDKAVAPVAVTDKLTRAIKDVGLEGERGGLGRLPYTNAEAAAILKFAPAEQTFSALGFDANQDTALKAELSQYRYLHFATHGLIDNTNPELSGLVLSLLDAQGRSIDGHLRMVEIYNMHLPAELVVLSACKTGLGKDVRGEGLMSLTRGFMYAGAKRVIVTLWDVTDKSTASLMGEFYRSLLSTKTNAKPSPAQALRAAQLWMLKQPQWQAPYYWAAFVQHGEPLGESK